MLDSTSLLQFDSFTFKISTHENKSKVIEVNATKTDESNYTQSFRFSESELKYLKFEHIDLLEYVVSSFLFNFRKNNK